MSVGYNDSVIMKYDNKQYAALNILKDLFVQDVLPFFFRCQNSTCFQMTFSCNGLTTER